MPYWLVHELIAMEAGEYSAATLMGALYPDVYVLPVKALDYETSHLVSHNDIGAVVEMGRSFGENGYWFSLALAGHILADRAITAAINGETQWEESLLNSIQIAVDLPKGYGLDWAPERPLGIETVVALIELDTANAGANWLQEAYEERQICFDKEIMGFLTELYEIPAPTMFEVNVVWLKYLSALNLQNQVNFAWNEITTFQPDLMVARLADAGWIVNRRSAVKVRQQVRSNMGQIQNLLTRLCNDNNIGPTALALSHHVQSHLMEIIGVQAN